MSGLSGDGKRGAMKAMGFCVLPVLLLMAAHGGISDALSASGQPLPKTPASPSTAATLPLPDTPAGGAARDLPLRSPWNPNSKPMPAPAPTSHYAGVAENSTGSAVA